MRLRSDPLGEEQVLNKEQGATLIPGVVERKGGPGEPRKKATPPNSWPQRTTGIRKDGLLELGKDILDLLHLELRKKC